MNESQIMHTFDYEVFLKRSGTVDRCMIEPTKRLMEAFGKVGGYATFFVDMVFIDLLRRNSPGDYRSVAEQLAVLADHGHRIELHLHPSWQDAVRNESSGEWITHSFKHYSLFSFAEQEVNAFFQNGIQLIQNILKYVDSNYTPKAFRAGGWSVGDGKEVSAAMRKYGIIIDSTVAPGMFHEKNPVSHYDFRRAPKNLPHWTFCNNPSIPVVYGDLMEIPISTQRIDPFAALQRKIKRRIYHKHYREYMQIAGDGQGMSIRDGLSGMQFLHYRFRNSVLPKYIMHTLQVALPGEMQNFIKNRQTVVTISHPKNLSHASFDELERSTNNGWKSITLLDYYNAL